MKDEASERRDPYGKVKECGAERAAATRKALVFEDEASLVDFALRLWRLVHLESLAGRGCMNVALSGGRTPVGLYRTLAQEEGLNWEKTHFFQADERFVPPIDKDSNYRMIQETLFDAIPVPPGNIYAVPVGVWGAEEGARRYEEELRRHFGVEEGRFPRFDLILLGLGEDGHTASLFPHSEALGEADRFACATRAARAPIERVTLTLPVINHGRWVIVLAEGSAKAEALKKALGKGQVGVPASLVRPMEGRLLFLADREAAGMLDGESCEVAEKNY